MKLRQGKNANVNYLAKIVRINNFRKHSDSEVEKLKCCSVDGFNIICGIESKPGLYVYFPTGCCLNPDFLKYANLYRHKELNNDSEQSGMFEDNGRVKAIRLRGELSEGFILPVIILENYLLSVTNQSVEIEENVEFDVVEHDGKTFWINKKYIPKNVLRQREHVKNSHSRQPKGIDRLIENQFRFHYDTILIKKVPYAIQPDDIIHISSKIHGTSHISARVLCKQPLNWKQKIAKWLTGEEFNIYDYLYSSRTVVKNKYYNKNVSGGFYGVDVWAEADKVIKPCLQKGMTIYAEIVGFLPDGSYIQKNYDYGCVPPEKDEPYTHEKHFKVRIYRITLTNVDGQVHEFSTQEVQQYCSKVGLVPVEEYYYGRAGALYPEICHLVGTDWNEEFLNMLANDKRFNMECNSPDCNNKVPHEGIVIKIENGQSAAFKLKCFRFLDKEGRDSDKGEISIEDEA